MWDSLLWQDYHTEDISVVRSALIDSHTHPFVILLLGPADAIIYRNECAANIFH